jgi:hypothetical protein
MTRPAVLALSAAVSAFALVVLGAAASLALRAPPPPVATAPETVPIEVVKAREAELTRLLEEANARLTAQAAPEPAPLAAERPRRHDDDHRGRRHERHEERDD